MSKLKGIASLFLAGVLVIGPGTYVPSVQAADATETTGTVASVAAMAKPSVVGILTTSKADETTGRDRSAGTGFMFKDGVIITNAHVVENASEVKILYPDTTVETVSPTEVYADAVSDIAVIKVKNRTLKPLAFGNSDNLTVGQQVVAVGNPLGFRLGNSVSTGILSGVGRALGSGYPFLQTDAPINPGNSGGPLFNLQGQVIGINSSKMAEIGVEGLGFSIPSNTASELANQLLRDGKIERPTLGISLYEGWEAYFGVPNKEGVTISSIISDGPAGMTALSSGDKLIKLDEMPIYTENDVFAFLATKRPGDVVAVTVKRRGQILSVKVKLASQGDLKKAAEEQGVEVGGILVDLTAGQIQEAVDFGRTLSSRYARINTDYYATSGSNHAILYTEYLYVARRISSAYQFGFKPGIGFQQSVAKDINRRIEVQLELNGDKANFLDGAVYMLEQKDYKTVVGAIQAAPTYTTSQDGSVVIANLAVRFQSTGLKPADDIIVTAKTADGKTHTFKFTTAELR